MIGLLLQIAPPSDTWFSKAPEWGWLIVVYFFLGGIAGGAAFLSGLLDLFGNIATALPMAKEGKVRALAVTSANRAPAAPDLPTVGESGLPGFESLSWFGVLAPAGTSPAVLRRLEAELQKAMALPAMKERLAAMGAMSGVHNAAGFAAVIQEEIKRWAPPPAAATVPRAPGPSSCRAGSPRPPRPSG